MSSAPLSGTVTVALPPEQAFEFFTASIGQWWPKDYHIGAADMADAILEPREGGRWYERGVDGSECDWGVVLAWDPPHRVVVTWQINGYWQFDADPTHASEIEIRFRAEGPAETVVELEHRNIERLVASENITGAFRSGGGWAAMLATFAVAATAAETADTAAS